MGVVFEAEIRIKRSDPRVLADDFEAVAILLAKRQVERELDVARFSRRSDD